MEQVAEVETESAIDRFRAAAQAREVAARSLVAVPAGAQPAPAVPGALPAWAEGVEVFVAAVEDADNLENTLTEKTRSDL